MLANAEETDKEELEQELVALRSSETERLQTVSDKITKSTADLTKLETIAQKNLAAAQETMGKLDEKLRATLAAFDARLAALEKISSRPAPAATKPERETAAPAPTPATAPTASDVPTPAVAAKPEVPETPPKTPVAHPPKMPRTSRREEIPAETSPGIPSPVQQVEIKELPPVKLQKIMPVAPDTRPPGKIPSSETAPASSDSAAPLPPSISTPSTSGNPPRKRPEKKSSGTSPAISVKESSGVHQPVFALETDVAVASRPPMAGPAVAIADAEFTQVSPDEAVPRAAVAADGATRLLVTAYIGIGNRLFIRGAGPGLSWDKGVPLQFVSIGKWRWETADATSPVKFKLYKNDELECTALGAQSLAPGHQQELTAAF